VNFLRGIWARLGSIVHEFMKFGVVGSFAYVVDVGLFNLLLYGGGDGPLNGRPLAAKTISVIAGTIVAYLGNRHWTFRHRASHSVAWGYTLFFLLNAVGLGITLTCLAISHYVLDLTGPLADNIAANVVGVAFGSAFRFWSYRRWVFPAPGEQEPHEQVSAV
jgi:putative flippase GtrA